MAMDQKERMLAAVAEAGLATAALDENELEKLWQGGYRSATRLRAASREGLAQAGLSGGAMDIILTLLRAKEGAGAGGAGGAGAGGLGSPDAAAEDDDVIVQRAAESCKYTGHVLHPVFKPVLDPKTKETVLNKEPVLVPSCAMVITPTCTATFAHNRTWKKGDEVDLQVCNHVDTTRTRSVKAKVADINEPCDYVILAHPDTELEAPVVDAGVMNRGSRFYGHGLCCPGGKPSVFHGMLACTETDKRGHIFGDIASGKGDSGGGVFSVASGKLIP